MADKKCTVTFTAPSTWSFDPVLIPVTGSGSTVTFEAAAGSNWTFTQNVTGQPALPSDWGVALISGNSKVKLTDPNNNVQNYKISVTVQINGTNNTYSSPFVTPTADTGVPPVIENNGTGDVEGKYGNKG
jgi:hypothetical protein